MTGWTWAWIAWGVYFLIVEGAALYRSYPGGTLSAHIWLWFGTRRRKPGEPVRTPSAWTRLRRIALIAFMVWLTAHFITGGWV